MNPISGLSALNAVPGVSSTHGANRATETTKADTATKPGAADAFDRIVGEIDSAQASADRAVVGLATGDVQDVHQVMIAMNEADLSFRMMLEVRNRLVDAYHEISRLQM